MEGGKSFLKKNWKKWNEQKLIKEPAYDYKFMTLMLIFFYIYYHINNI